jgi:hypothetical protein
MQRDIEKVLGHEKDALVKKKVEAAKNIDDKLSKE